MRKTEKPISLIFLSIITIFITVLLYYLSIPVKNDKTADKKKNYQDYLEYNVKEPKRTAENIKTNISSTTYEEQNYNEENNNEIQNSIEQYNKYEKTEQTYNELLDRLKEYPEQSTNSIEQIVNRLLEYKGYYPNTVEVTYDSINQERAKTQGSYMIAQFDFKTGKMIISKEKIYELDIKTIIAILAHELDHFEKLAVVCKSMGVENFANFLNENKISEIDKEFWKQASEQTKNEEIDPQYYKEALERFINQNSIELTSSYSDFYRLAENMRNPLEISAYEVSDYIYDYYNIPREEGPLRQITKQFNNTDWAIYQTAKNNRILSSERIALFDYFFSQAIKNNYPQYNEIYEKCINEKNGDLSEFWLEFEKTLSNFYGRGQINNETLNKILQLLKATEQEAKNGLTDIQAANAIKYKAELIKSNIVYPNALKNMRHALVSYLEFTKEKNINDPKGELNAIIDLICIDNEIYTNNSKQISLYYIKIPEEIKKRYKIDNKHKNYLFIYRNEEFKRMIAEKSTFISEEEYLKELIEKNRLNVKI